MGYPVFANDDGVNLNPKIMEKEKIYHCIFKNKAILVFKDSQDLLNCYEIEEADLVERIRGCGSDADLERLLGDYISEHHQN